MWWTSLYVNKQHNTICGGLTIHKQTTQHNMWWTSLYVNKQTQHNMWWTSLYINKQHNTICGGPHYT